MKIGDVVHVATWVDKRKLARTNQEDDLSERLERATVAREFPTLRDAMMWAEQNEALDEVGPR